MGQQLINTVAGSNEKGTNETIRFAIGQSSMGTVLAAHSERGLCAIFLGDDPDLLISELQGRFPKVHLLEGGTEYQTRVEQVVNFVENPDVGLSQPLDIRGTAFQTKVWQALREIPPGKTVSYTDVAEQIGAPRSVRAVAQACGANAIAVAIPCHRVVRRDGGLSGYRWGIHRKHKLLEREGAQLLMVCS